MVLVDQILALGLATASKGKQGVQSWEPMDPPIRRTELRRPMWRLAVDVLSVR